VFEADERRPSPWGHADLARHAGRGLGARPDERDDARFADGTERVLAHRLRRLGRESSPPNGR